MISRACAPARIMHLGEVEAVRKRVDGTREAILRGEHACSLEIVVRVTSACNFACPYCFQHRRAGHMAPEVRDALVRFVERRLASGRYDHLGIEWFGGEPLLAPDIIDGLGALGSRARDLCFPSDQPQCLECKFLPCCLGGCPMHRIEEGVPECPSALFDPDSFAIERLMEKASPRATTSSAP